MPNHVTTRCVVTGPPAHISAFVDRMIRTSDDDGKPYTRLDFEQIIPMPAVASSVEENGLNADVLTLLAESSGMVPVWQSLQRFDREGHLGPWKGLVGFERGEIEARLEKAFPGCIEKARAMARCIAETGCKSWYDWSINHWGTKWNSYGYNPIARTDDRFEFKFETAWNFPEPIFRKIGEMFPALRFECIGFDEGWNFAVKGHVVGSEYSIAKLTATDELYEAVYDRKPEHDDEDAA